MRCPVKALKLLVAVLVVLCLCLIVGTAKAGGCVTGAGQFVQRQTAYQYQPPAPVREVQFVQPFVVAVPSAPSAVVIREEVPVPVPVVVEKEKIILKERVIERPAQRQSVRQKSVTRTR